MSCIWKKSSHLSKYSSTPSDSWHCSKRTKGLVIFIAKGYLADTTMTCLTYKTLFWLLTHMIATTNIESTLYITMVFNVHYLDCRHIICIIYVHCIADHFMQVYTYILWTVGTSYSYNIVEQLFHQRNHHMTLSFVYYHMTQVFPVIAKT